MNDEMLSNVMTVLHLRKESIEDIDDSSLTFGQKIEDDEDASFSVRLVAISRDTWEEMGEPEMITVTIEPRDALND